jgi:hypothetical protein
MVGQKTDPRSADCDMFECVLCHTVVTFPFEQQMSKKAEKSAL